MTLTMHIQNGELHVKTRKNRNVDGTLMFQQLYNYTLKPKWFNQNGDYLMKLQ